MQQAGPPATDDLLSGLTESQRLAVTSEASPLCVLASAGAGKTRVLTRRIAHRVQTGTASAGHVLALTFTRKAAGELQARLRSLGLRDQVAAGTFHSVASAQLQRWWADRRAPAPVLLERKGRLLGPLATSRAGMAGVALSELAGHIEWAKARLVTPDGFEAAVAASGRSLPRGVAAPDLAALYARYEHEKTRRGLVDFDDLLGLCAQAIEQDPAFAAAQRWRWRHLFVDEFQDLNPLQHRLLLAWLGASEDLCVVGDPNQAIYGWNGADPGLLAQVPSRWPSTEVLYLDDNHRCSPQIVRAAAAVLGDAGRRLRSAAPDGLEPSVRSFPTDEAEARGISAQLRGRHDAGLPWRSMAVLARTNAQLAVIEEALAAARIPFWAPARRSLLAEPAAQRVLAELRSDRSRPLQAVAADLASMAADAEGAAPSQAPASAASLIERAEDSAVLTALAGLARSYHRDEPAATVGQWLSWLPAALRDDPAGPGSDAVTLCTFHRAKGLEWDAVWVAGLEEGLVPIATTSRSAGRSGAEGDAEERRLLYVALTRPSAELRCSWARSRSFGGRRVPRDPSPWVPLIESPSGRPNGPVEGPAGAVEGPAGAVDWRARLRDQRRVIAENQRAGRGGGSRRRRGRSPLPTGLAEADAVVFEALREWRSGVARSSGVPAYVVMHDVTLAAVASMRPTSVDELLGVPGLGPVKAARYGPVVVSIVSELSGSSGLSGSVAETGACLDFRDWGTAADEVSELSSRA